MGQGKGAEYYKNTYTHEQLWQKLITDGDSWSVEQGGSVWRTASADIENAKTGLDTAMSQVADYWQGSASEEFQRRMEILREYGDEAASGMERVSEYTVPELAGFLKEAQQKARDQDLYPEHTLTDYDEWLEQTKPEDLQPGTEKEQNQRPQLQREHADYIEERHEAMAIIVADLGQNYQDVADTFREPPSPPPTGMPGNDTYQQPTGGVFGSSGLGPTGGYTGGGSGPGSANFANDNQFNGAGSDDLEPVDGWDPASYTDLDSNFEGGALASGGSATAFAPGGGPGATSVGGAGTTGTGTGAGLFGPARSSGAGSAPGRGTGSNSPARSGANRPASSTRGSGSGRGTGGRGSATGRGINSRGVGPRGGTRSGHNDDDEEEEYTRETWLKEDDVNWGRNRTPDEELDD
ncbi:WXG100 family type VII secretion target [Glycomyces xiaoerkulensis]|uniref:WXG100 family type VII secretion target n=1 Tax=Glycomyces xiaoerkulensis TaxID=2038139 RepID=UPI000C268ACE|nr:hypothetical protein [Glycomyces xiaoerkulensis]